MCKTGHAVRSSTAVLFTMSGRGPGMRGISDNVDLGCWGGQSRQAARVIVTSDGGKAYGNQSKEM